MSLNSPFLILYTNRFSCNCSSMNSFQRDSKAGQKVCIVPHFPELCRGDERDATDTECFESKGVTPYLNKYYKLVIQCDMLFIFRVSLLANMKGESSLSYDSALVSHYSKTCQ